MQNRLAGNFIHTIHVGLFSGLRHLSALLLMNNQLETIESGAFDNTSLSIVDFSYNGLTFIPSGTFRGTQLTELVLVGNDINIIPKGAWEGLNASALKSCTTLDCTNIWKPGFYTYRMGNSICATNQDEGTVYCNCSVDM